MLIEMNTGEATGPELIALAEMLMNLAGMMGTTSTLALVTRDVAGKAPPPPAAAPPPPPLAAGATAEDLMAAEAARVAALNPPATDGVDRLKVPDKEGLPWDARIHSSNQKQTAKGVWQAARNLDPATAAKVRAELHAAMAAPAIPIGGAAPPPPVTTAAAPPPPNAAPPPPPLAAGATMDPAQFATATLADLMMRVVDLQGFGIITPEEVVAKCTQLGLSQTRDFAARPDLIPHMMALLPAMPAS